MKLPRMTLAGCMLAVVSSVALTAASAEEPQAGQALTGVVTEVNRISGTITVQQPQSGTVGANSGRLEQQYKVDAGMLENVHAEDRIKFSVSDVGGKKTITKIERQ